MWETTKNQLKAFVQPYVLIILAVAGVVIWIQWQLLKHARLDAATKDAKLETLGTQFQQMQKASIEQAQMFKSEVQAQKAAYDRFGSDVMTYMKANDATLQTIHDAVGGVEASVGTVHQSISALPDGRYSSEVIQQRPNPKGGTFPPLTTFKFAYDPKANDIVGNWFNNEEVFDFSLGTWKQAKGGYISAVSGKRLIYKTVDGKKVLVGEEQIPFQNATATFTEQAFVPDGTVLSVPRFTLSLGAGKDMSPSTPNKWVLAGGIDYRFSNKVGAGINFIGTNSAITASYRFGK